MTHQTAGAALLTLLVLGAAPFAAQTPGGTAGRPAFDVASVKPNRSADIGGFFGGQRGQLTVRNVSLWDMVRNAYRLQGFQIVGGPDWIRDDRFDVIARASTEVTPEEMALMVQTLLADRFGLVVHRETRDMPIYALVVARTDRGPSPQLRPSSTDCAAVAAAGRGALPPRPEPGVRPLCGTRTQPGRMMAGGVTMPTLARNLSVFSGRVVVDKTGLDGAYDFDLEWMPERLSPETPPPGVAPLPPVDPNAPSLFTALQEQLGLKLDSQRGPVDVLVIDSASRPTPD